MFDKTTKLIDVLQPYIEDKLEQEILDKLYSDFEQKAYDLKDKFIKEAEEVANKKAKIMTQELFLQVKRLINS